MNKEKFCKDCKYCQPSDVWMNSKNPFEFAKCLHPKAKTKSYERTDLISGETKVYGEGRQIHCEIMRRDFIGFCGKKGRLFRAINDGPKISFWQKIKDYFSLKKE